MLFIGVPNRNRTERKTGTKPAFFPELNPNPNRNFFEHAEPEPELNLKNKACKG